MTIERWNDDRLDRLATAIDSLRQQGETNTRNIDALRQQTETSTRNVDILVGIVTGHQQHITNLLEEIRDIKVEIRVLQAEIRGLQTENRRILDRLFGQQEDTQ